MKCNKLAFLTVVVAAVVLLHAPSSSLAQHQQPQPFNQMGQEPQYFQPSGFSHGGKNANSLEMNKYQHVKYSGAPAQGGQQGPNQPQPQFGNMGMGTQPPQPQPGSGNRVRGGNGGPGPVSGGVGMGGPGNGNVRLPGQSGPGPVRNGNGRPMEQQPAQPQQATFIPPGPMATISFGSPQTQSPAPSSPSHFSGPNNNNNNGQGPNQAQGSQEKAKGQTNTGSPAAFPQSNSNGMSVHNSNLPSNLAANTFGMPALNSWNSQPHLVNNNGNNGGETPKPAGNRFKVTSINIQNGESKLNQQSASEFNKQFTPFQPPNENFGIGTGVGGFKFPVDDAPIQDNHFGPSNDGFGNTGAASTTISFGTGFMPPNFPTATKGKGKHNTLKKGKFSWTSPDGQVYEISYVADLKDKNNGNSNGNGESAGPVAAPKSTPEENGFYQTAFPYSTNGNMISMSEPPRNGLELFGSGSAPSPDYLVHANSRGAPYQQPFNGGGGNGFMMSPPQMQRFVPSRGF